jgi:hypothetical protein
MLTRSYSTLLLHDRLLELDGWGPADGGGWSGTLTSSSCSVLPADGRVRGFS